MRRPSLTTHEDDKSRLTTGSTTSSLSTSTNTNNSYFPNIISSAEWQNGRKRKDRQDSTSSSTQDRKLVRSNSEEQLPNVSYDGFRRVSSHEDFNKKPLHLSNNERPISEEICLKADELHNELNKENGVKREERHSPHRDARAHAKRHQHDEDEHERRRNHERFCRTRAGGRKSSSPRKSSKFSPILTRQSDKKFEGRGFDDTGNSNSILIEDVAETTPIDEVAPKPWANAGEDAPVVCQRFATNTFSHVMLNNNTNFSKHQAKYEMAAAAAANDDQPVNPFVTPEERIKQINKRLASLKKRVVHYEENFERDYGYRPSQADKMNDKSVKHAIGEIHKLRKEKAGIKSDPMAAMGYRTTSDAGVPKDKKLDTLKETLHEIEKVGGNIFQGKIFLGAIRTHFTSLKKIYGKIIRSHFFSENLQNFLHFDFFCFDKDCKVFMVQFLIKYVIVRFLSYFDFELPSFEKYELSGM